MARNIIEFECPRCLQQVKAGIEQAGQRINCPGCQGSLMVPSQSVAQDLFDDLFETETAATESTTQRQSDSGSSGLATVGASDSSATIELTDPQPTSLPTEPEESVAAESAEDDLLADLEIPGIDIAPVEADAAAGNPLDGIDPFEVDPDAPLKIDGIGDVFSNTEAYGFKCKICDTRIHVTPEQAGSSVQCPECYSQVDVPAESAVPRMTQKWQKEGRAATQKSSDELRLSDPIERPKIDYNIDESFGLAPVSEDLLAPKADDEEVGDVPAPPSQDMPDVQSQTHQGQRSPVKRSSKQGAQSPSARQQPSQKSRRQRYEESMQRQATSQSKGKRSAPATPSATQEPASEVDVPSYSPGSLLTHLYQMLFNSGLVMRAALAVALMCLGSLVFQWSQNPGEISEEDKTFVNVLLIAVKGLVFGGVPYLVGLATLWYASARVFRHAAEGQSEIESWKTSGAADRIGTFLLFSFGFFIGGLPMAPWTILILPLRMLLAPLFLLSAWHQQSPFAIVSIDAFKKFRDQHTLWNPFYGYMAGLGFCALVTGGCFWLRDFTDLMFFKFVLTIPAVLMMTGITLVFAAITGWHVSKVMSDLSTE